MTDNENKFWAFISYSQQDNCAQRPDAPTSVSVRWGDCLHAAFKNFSIPAEFIGQPNGRGEMIPEQIQPIFQDEKERSENTSLSAETRAALDKSICLVVICSPRSAKSSHVNEVVRYFKQLGRSKNIFPIVIAGEPNVSDGNHPAISSEAECFVPALRHPVAADGTLDTTRRAGKSIFVDARHGAEKREILANDHRSAEADLEMAKIQLIALLAGVGFNGLWWREQRRHFFDFAEAQQQARAAQHQVAEVRRQLEETQRQALENQKLPPEIHAQIQDAQNQARESQTRARDVEKQLQEFQNQVRETQAQLDAARSRAVAAEGKVLETQQQAREIQVQLESARSQARDAQGKVLELQSLPPVVPGQNEEAQAQLAELRQQAQAARNQFLEAQKQVQELQRQEQSAQSELAQARNEVRAAQAQVSEIQNQTRDAQGQIQAAQVDVQKIQNKTRTARRLTQVFAVLAALALLAAGLATSMMLRQRNAASAARAQAESATSGKFELATAGSGTEPIRQVLEKIGGAEQAENRQRSLEQIVAAIPTTEIPAVLNVSAVIVNDQQRSQFQKSLLLRLGAANPLSAMTNASAIVGSIVNADGQRDSAGYFQLAVLDGWMQADFPAAFKWVLALPETNSRQRALEKMIQWLKSQADFAGKNQALATGIKALAQMDFLKAVALAEALPDDAGRDQLLAELWRDADPFSLVHWANLLNFPQAIMSLQKPAWLGNQFLPNTTTNGLSAAPAETKTSSAATNGPTPSKLSE
jgi:uncharacterized coiled-coil DUF342 family protein